MQTQPENVRINFRCQESQFADSKLHSVSELEITQNL